MIASTYEIMSVILPYYGTFRNWKYLMKRLSVSTHKLWEEHQDQFKQLIVVKAKSVKVISLNTITVEVLQKIVNCASKHSGFKIACKVTTHLEYELIYKLALKIYNDKLPIGFKNIEFKNIIKNIENYQGIVSLLLRIGVAKDVIKGTLYSLTGALKSSSTLKEIDYVESAIGKNCLRIVKDCNTLFFDRSVANCINKRQPKITFKSLDISITDLDEKE